MPFNGGDDLGDVHVQLDGSMTILKYAHDVQLSGRRSIVGRSLVVVVVTRLAPNDVRACGVVGLTNHFNDFHFKCPLDTF